ncbi:hypothetical protein BD779DRAFT_1435664 [Infundibulicybe gibba]|nr:hypothetical protein BD779DRAFT_1435664 [Infundibulicybe gibba]
MDFLNTYDIPSAATPPAQPQPEQSLNEEVSQVMGQLGRFWGGFRKQSQTALEAARKDLGDVVVQAQKELSKLTTTNESTQGTHSGQDTETGTDDEPSAETTPEASSSNIAGPSRSSSTQTLFSRLQSALPPNIVSTVRDNLPDTLKHASENIDLGQLRTNLLSEFQRVQGVTRAQAEEYAHKSEALLREAVKEAGEVLRDAVKVVPPEETSTDARSSGLIWDGTDMWMLPLDTTEPIGPSSSSGKMSRETQRAVATRADSLLRRLKHDPTILQHDPEVDPALREVYHQWIAAEVDAKEGGVAGDEWGLKISSILEEEGDGDALKGTLDTLVPSSMSSDVFWCRFFFRVHQIEQEEAKRKALIEGSVDIEEDFSWEDDEEESNVPTSAPTTPPMQATESDSATGSIATLAPPTTAQAKAPDSDNSLSPPSQTHTGTTTSPRESSEDSFDVVSSNVSVNEEPTAEHTENPDDDDSDWE